MKAVSVEIVTQAGALSASESQQLKAAETDIEKGGSLIVAAMELIRDNRLYRATHDSFDAYCRERWAKTDRAVNLLIQSEAVIQAVAKEFKGEQFVPPVSHGAARELVDLTPKQAAEVVRTVVESGEKPTAKNLAGAVSEYFEGKGKISGGNTFDPQELDAAPASPASPTVMTDAISRPVPSKLNAACSAAAALESLARKVDPIKREAESLSQQPGGDFVEMAEVNRLCRELKTAIGHAAYWTACPRCKGKCCDRCKVGWIPRCRSGHLSDDDRAALGMSK